MEIVSIIITLIALIATVVFGYLQIVVPFINKEVRLAKKFPFVESTETPKKRRRRKTKKPGRRWLIPVTAVAVVIIAIILFRVLLLQAAELPPKPIAVMTFKNLTGDENYDYLCEAISNLLITNLEQSEHLQVMTWERMHDLLGVMGEEDIGLIDEETGFELCRMGDVNTIVIGSFTKAGNMFVTEVKVLDVASKKIFKTSSSQGEGVASILKNQIDELSKDIARNVSLYERVAAPTDMQVMEVTTTSMEAYNYFLKGREEFEKLHWADARKFLEKAIEIDSTFASAYYYLALSNHWLGDIKARNDAYERAKALSGRATDKERLWIEAGYAADVERDREKYYRIIQHAARKYPKEKGVYTSLARMYRDKKSFPEAIEELHKALELDPNYGDALNLLGYMYAEIGDHARAIECFKRYASVLPGDANPFDSMGDLYLEMGQLDEALAQYQQAIFVKPDFGHSKDQIAYIYALREDYAEAMNWCDSLITTADSPDHRACGYLNKALYGELSGNIDQAQCDLDTARALSKNLSKFRMATVEYLRALTYYHQGKFRQSQNHLKACYDNSDAPFYNKLPDIPYNTIFYNFFLGLIDVKQKHLDSAWIRLAIIRPLLPDVAIQDKNWAQFLHDLLYAEVLLAQDSIEKSIMVGENSSKYKVEMIDRGFEETHIPQDVIARAYLKKGDIDRAIIEYEKLVDPDPNKPGRFLIRPTWRYALAKLYEEKGLRAKAIEQYGKFLDIWKNADEDLPEPHDAKKCLAKLKAAS